MDQVITLDRNDDILKLHSKVEWSDGRRVILVVPRGCKALDAEHELRLLRRWADSSDLQVGLVTSDINVREMATDIGLPFFSSVQNAQRARWQWQSNGDNKFRRPTPLDDDLQKPKQAALDRLGLAGAQLLITLALFGFAALVLAIAAILFVPSAQISIVPASVLVSDSRELIVDPNVDSIDQVNGVIPATAIRREISGTATIATTKTDRAPADHSTGRVTFTNLAGTPTTIPIGTIVETSSGVTVRFSTTVAAQLPGGYNSRVVVPVRALERGPGGNVKPLQINFIEGPIAAVARVVNLDPTSGGTIEDVHIVSFEDKQKLRDKLAEELRAAAVSKLQAQAGDQAYIPPASVAVTVLNESFDHLVDDPSDTLSLHDEAVAQGISVDADDIQKYAERNLLEKVPEGYAVMPGTLKLQPDLNGRAEGTSVIIKLRSALYATPSVRGGDVLKGLAGKKPDEAALLIEDRMQLAKPPLVQISPAWWPRLPFIDFRIALFVTPELQAKSP